jgi:hypothetical protein
MRDLADQTQAEAKRPRPDDGRIEALAAELNQVEADLAVERAAARERILAGVDENGNPVKGMRVHTRP